jgi:hypothetical protein
MKNLLFSVALLWGAATFAQKNNGHEIKVGVPIALKWPSAEVSYEYLFRDIFTFGAASGLSLNQSAKPDQVFFFESFARLYVYGSSYDECTGPFIQAFGQFFTGNDDLLNAEGTDWEKVKYSAGAAGVAVGDKYVIGPVVFEGLIGGGGIFGYDGNHRGVFKLSLRIGYRF